MPPSPEPSRPPEVQISRPSRPAEGLAEAVVENILMTYCGACHGPLLGNEALGGIGFIDDVEELTARGYIVPLNSAASRIIAVMRDGSMPPRNTAYARVAEADIDVEQLRGRVDHAFLKRHGPGQRRQDGCGHSAFLQCPDNAQTKQKRSLLAPWRNLIARGGRSMQQFCVTGSNFLQRPSLSRRSRPNAW